jgi:DNA-binding NarL/FixJ family response regulator
MGQSLVSAAAVKAMRSLRIAFGRSRMPESLHMLIVDDDPRTRDALAAFLSVLDGIGAVLQASDGWEAIDLIQTQRTDIVLMDIRMPHLDGLEAARIVKTAWPETKVIMLSMYPEYRAEALEVGADAFLVKGGTAEDLVTTIRSVAPGHWNGTDPSGLGSPHSP